MALSRSLAAGLAIALTATAATAGATEPGDVKFEGATVTASLTGEPGDPARGRATYVDRKLGNCLACHVSADVENEPFPGNVGPALDGVADRLDPGELRLIVANPRLRDPSSTMPASYDVSPALGARNPSLRQPWLTAQQVEDLVAWLSTLHGPAPDTGK